MNDPVRELKLVMDLVRNVRHELEQLRSGSELVTKSDLNAMEHRIMSQFSEFVTEVEQKFNEITPVVDTVVGLVTNVATDVTWLKNEIVRLQNLPGTWTPEEEASAQAIKDRIAGLGTTVKTAADALKALDEATDSSAVPTPPTPPPV